MIFTILFHVVARHQLEVHPILDSLEFAQNLYVHHMEVFQKYKFNYFLFLYIKRDKVISLQELYVSLNPFAPW